MSKQILILAGDGIGPEIVKAAEQVLTRVNEKFNLDLSWEHGLLGGAAIDAHGAPYPDVTSEQAKKADDERFTERFELFIWVVPQVKCSLPALGMYFISIFSILDKSPSKNCTSLLYVCIIVSPSLLLILRMLDIIFNLALLLHILFFYFITTINR